MIIVISGKAGSGKSTIAKLLASKLGFKHYSSGDFMRAIARERGISLLELSKIAENDLSIDKEIDERQINLGKQEDNFVIDARLGGFFIPQALKIFLDCGDKVRAERILKEGRKEEKNRDIDDVLEKIHIREESERKRYNKLYQYDYFDEKNYDFTVDTSDLNIKEVLDRVFSFISKYL